ncbi:aminodeoxychorismate lyase [Xylocopilactobacillus apis]|uniref:Endolytic murein transglycosylase n=2 Tax=Xylocopilactobacillus apis TaxID=2932183 RepID=A0AAU9DI67_9LACO|nr:endolytic transglycosylase MltG [Xylocopilactobacillus apis]BDR56427.1 aminodeoxychorismate lyase [Xylocopilactobacillus apis]
MNKDNMPSRKSEKSLNKFERRQQDNKTVKHISAWIIGILATVIVITGVMFYKYVETSLKPVNPESSKVIKVKIPVGSTNKDIAHLLEQKRIIKSATVFNIYVKTNNVSDFKAGIYEFRQSDTIKQISSKLQEGGKPLNTKEETGKIMIPEGLNISSIEKEIVKKSHFSKSELEKLFKDEKFFNSLVKKYPALLKSAQQSKNVRYRLEGYLYPATYTVYKGMTAKDLIEQMVEKTNSILSYYNYFTEIKNKGYTVQQFLTLASLVEKEGITEKDRRMIAGVFMNRMDVGMPLQTDISVMYALNTHKTHLTNKDTSVESPYNLYKNSGYGPGPFCSPSLSSMKAVLNPLDRDKKYMYFVADLKTKKVYYSRTYDEQIQKQEETGN